MALRGRMSFSTEVPVECIYIRDTPGNVNAVGSLRRDLVLRCIIAAARRFVLSIECRVLVYSLCELIV